ncbi:hypothetical protein [Chamaesiphon sp.]|uniref:hypothetical protein n=1 Tax=Chamaesiphon sp. TaxID=2814140 RepID=UPI0035941A10
MTIKNDELLTGFKAERDYILVQIDELETRIQTAITNSDPNHTGLRRELKELALLLNNGYGMLRE